MRWCFLLVAFIGMMLTAGSTSGQDAYSVDIGGRRVYINPDIVDRVPFDPAQVADAIVVMIPDVRYDLDVPMPTERIIQGSIVRVEKGVMPTTIVHTANTFTDRFEAGVPRRLYLVKYKDRNAYYLIASHPVDGARPQ